MSARIEKITGTGIPLLMDDIDTDRIIPARYLRCVTFEGLGEHAFEDDRKQDADHPFDKEHHRGASILVSGRNFGCGSSREHAPQALIRWGLKAVVAESFAEIFHGNCTSLGVPAVTASREDLEQLEGYIQENPRSEVTIDLLARQIYFGDQSIPCGLPDSAHSSLTTGEWDFLSQLLEGEKQIRTAAQKLPYLANFA